MPEASGTRDRERDMVLNPRQFAFILDQTKGHVTAYVGPNRTSLANTDRPVRVKAKGKDFVFEECRLEEAVQEFPLADEGSYIVLSNAARDDATAHPPAGQATPMAPLNFGRTVNIPGPETFPLWPAQIAQVIRGHNLRSNQYLLVRVYNEAEAQRNWTKAVVKKVGTTDDKSKTEKATEPPELVTGQLIAIKGTDVSFYIPPTGCEVLADEKGQFVRDAVTLERLEFCVLLDEDGNKRFVRGPAVVFPDPTETFVRTGGEAKFKAIELNENSGIYVKVIAPYQEGSKAYKEGDELFITGKEQMIYFPRPEHSIIRYGNQVVHFAIAIPEGEARYVLDKQTGQVSLVKGPKMFLPDPRREVVVRRKLSSGLVGLMYPGNSEAIDYNAMLDKISAKRKGSDFVTEREVRRGLTGTRSKPRTLDTLKSADIMPRGGLIASGLGSTLSYNSGDAAATAAATALLSSVSPTEMADVLSAEGAAFDEVVGMVGDDFERSHTYTPPVMVTLDTKYDGAVTMQVWTGYAVLLVAKSGERRVVIGPTTALLSYDETPHVLELSTGTPKGEATKKTVYLRVNNNKVSDLIEAVTKDMVRVSVRVAYRVSFEGEPERWFAVENYVNFLCDHGRSLIRNAVKQIGIEEFNAKAVTIVRDTILGAVIDGHRAGRKFEENGMRATDVEVLDIGIGDATIATMLVKAQHEAVQQAVAVAQKEQNLERTRRIESINRDVLDEQALTEAKQRSLKEVQLTEGQKLAVLEMSNVAARDEMARELQLKQADTILLRKKVELQAEKDVSDATLLVEQERAKLTRERLEAETAALVARQQAVTPDLVAALQAFGDKAAIESLMKALGPHALLQGKSVPEVLAQLLAGSPGIGDRLVGLLGGGNGNGGTGKS
jgi:major vault protein